MPRCWCERCCWYGRPVDAVTPAGRVLKQPCKEKVRSFDAAIKPPPLPPTGAQVKTDGSLKSAAEEKPLPTDDSFNEPSDTGAQVEADGKLKSAAVPSSTGAQANSDKVIKSATLESSTVTQVKADASVKSVAMPLSTGAQANDDGHDKSDSVPLSTGTQVKGDGSGKSATVPSSTATQVKVDGAVKSATMPFYNADGKLSKADVSLKLAADPKPEDDSTVAPSIGTSSSVAESSSGRSFLDLKGRMEAVNWKNIKHGTRILSCCAHAHCVDDIYLLSVFLDLAELPDIDTDSVKLLLRALKLLHLCNYSTEDVCSMLAHASAYFLDIYSQCGTLMYSREVGNVLVTLVFVAQCYVQDETCPLHVWHKHLFKKYCPLSTLNAAVIRLMEMRGFMMRLEDEDLDHRYGVLIASTQRSRAVSSAGNGESTLLAAPVIHPIGGA